MPVIPMLERQKWEDLEFKARLGYRARPDSKQRNKQTKG
jgi:hypothetical protein